MRLLIFCFAFFGLWAASGAAASSMTMTALDEQVIASGTIGAHDCTTLRGLLHDNGRLRIVVLRNSHGGDPGESDCLSAAITERHAATAVSGFCEAACAVVFLAGSERHFTDDYPATATWLGFQSIYDNAGKVMTEKVDRLAHWIEQQTDRRIDPTLLDFWTHLDDPDKMVFFFKDSPLRPGSGIDAAYCYRKNDSTTRCASIPDTTALSNQILTSAENIRSADMTADPR